MVNMKPLPEPSENPKPRPGTSPGPQPGGEGPEPRRPFQYRLSTLFLLTTLMSVLAMALGGIYRHGESGDALKVRFILITLLAPLGLVMLVGLWQLLTRPRGPKKPRW